MVIQYYSPKGACVAAVVTGDERRKAHATFGGVSQDFSYPTLLLSLITLPYYDLAILHVAVE